MKTSRAKSVVLTGFLTVVLATASFAQPTLVTDRASLGAVDFVDWIDFGPEFANVPSGSTISSNLGMMVTITNPSGDFQRLDQSSGWFGNFAPGDPLIFTAGNVGPTVITFAVPVSGAGAQIQRNTFGAFTATIELYDSSDMMIASFDVPGDSNSNEDNSAIFVGVEDTSPTIARIEYSVDGVDADFAINQLDIGAGGVPTMGQLGLVLLFLVLASVSVVTLLRRRSA